MALLKSPIVQLRSGLKDGLRQSLGHVTAVIKVLLNKALLPLIRQPGDHLLNALQCRVRNAVMAKLGEQIVDAAGSDTLFQWL